VGLLWLVLLSGATLGILAWKAARTSLSLEPLRGRIEGAIANRLPADSSVRIGSASLALRREGLLVKAHDVTLTIPEIGTLSIQELATGATPATLLSRRIDLTSVTASGVVVGVSVARAARPQGSAAEAIRASGEMLAAGIDAANRTMRRAGLDAVTIREAALHLVDETGRRSPGLRIAEADWLPLDPGGSTVRLQIADEAKRTWQLTLEQRRAEAAGALIDLGIEGLPVAALVPELGDADGGLQLRATLRVDLELVTARDGTFSMLNAEISTGQGILAFAESEQIEIAGGGIEFALAGTDERLAIPRGELRTRSGGIGFHGSVDLSGPDAILVAEIVNGTMPDLLGGDPIRLTGGEVLARLDVPNRGIAIERIHFTTSDGSVSATGQASLVGPAPGLSFALALSEMPMAVARAFWPPFVASKTRQWFDKNVRSGRVGPATLRIALPPGHIGRRGRGRVLPDYALLGSLPFRDAAFSPISALPVIEAAAGEIAFANATATLRADSGVMAIAGKGQLQVGGTRLTIPELGRPRLWGKLQLALTGSAAALASLSDMPPFSIAASRGIHAEDLSGNAELALDAEIPLFPAPLTNARPIFRLALTDFSSTSPIADRMIGDTDLVLAGTPERFAVIGDGLLDGMQASIDLVLGSEAAEQRDVTVSLDDAARERLGLGLGGLVSGSIEASIRTMESGGEAVELDLEKARIDLPFLGWEKGPGVAATATFLLTRSDAGTRITDLSIAGKGFAAAGSLVIDSTGKLRDLQLTELVLRPGDDVTVTARADGVSYDVRVAGSSIDARGILRGLRGGVGREGNALPVRVALDVGSVRGEDDVVLSNVSGWLAFGTKGLDTASLQGQSGGNRGFDWTLGRDGDTRTLRLIADDAGALLKFTGLYGKVAGGNLVIDYGGTVGGAGRGVVMMRDFRVVEESALAPAVRSAQSHIRERGLPVSDNDTATDLSFAQLRIPFRQEGWVIAMDDAALRGPMLGATASGTINIPGGRVAISGTFIPAFGINNIAGAIPLLGTILGGGRDEGLVGITYKLFGPLSHPELTINPISAITPGIFRRIFEYD
jgi:hypothetical protein